MDDLVVKGKKNTLILFHFSFVIRHLLEFLLAGRWSHAQSQTLRSSPRPVRLSGTEHRHRRSPMFSSVDVVARRAEAQRWKGLRAFFLLRCPFPPSLQLSLGSPRCVKKPGWGGGGPELAPPGWVGVDPGGKNPPLDEVSLPGAPWKIRLKKSCRSEGEPGAGVWPEGDLRERVNNLSRLLSVLVKKVQLVWLSIR